MFYGMFIITRERLIVNKYLKLNIEVKIMPSKTKRQAKFMAFCAHAENPPKSCPPKKVAREFNKTDKKTGILKNSQETSFPFLKDLLEFEGK